MAERLLDGTDMICPNSLGCPAQIEASLAHYVSRGAMDIESLGKERIKELLDLGYITDIASLYRLDDRAQELENRKGWGEKSVKKLLDEIEKSRTKSLDRLVFALGIPSVGEVTAADLASKYHSLDQLSQASYDDLKGISSVKAAKARQITDFFKVPANLAIVKRLSQELNPSSPRKPLAKATGPLVGRRIVFTGEFKNYKREAIKELARQQGALVSDSVSKNTNYLVAGANPHSKAAKAADLKVIIISEDSFVALTNGEDPSRIEALDPGNLLINTKSSKRNKKPANNNQSSLFSGDEKD